MRYGGNGVTVFKFECRQVNPQISLAPIQSDRPFRVSDGFGEFTVAGGPLALLKEREGCG